LKNSDNNAISTKFTYLITFLLGLSFSLTLIQSAWKTAIERKQKDFQFEILSVKQAVTRNVLTGNDITNNVAAYMSSNDDVQSSQFDIFAKDILERYQHIEAINYYTFNGSDLTNEFPLMYQYARSSTGLNSGDDIYLDPRYRDAIDTSVITSSVVPAPPDTDNNQDRKYWLFKAIYSNNPSLIEEKNYSGVVTGIVSVLVSPSKLIGNKGLNSSLTITMFSDTSNLYGRQLLYFNEPVNTEPKGLWKIETLTEEDRIQLPPYSIKIIINKDLYVSDLEYHLLLVSILIGVGIILMLHGLVKAKAKQEEYLKNRNAVIEQKVEEQTHELAIARDEALEGARMKSEFLASMSHEIRTPLNAIIGMSDLMSETQLTNEQNRYVSVFKKAGDTLLSLVNDILDLSKIEADQLVLEDLSFDIVELLEEAAEIYALKAADKDIEIITLIDANVNVNRMGDPNRLKQIILNLISNAFKFTDKGEIVVSLTQSKDDQEYLIISVKDTGIGIPQSKLEAIFASFTQADTSTTRKYGGTGLGLTISKRLTEMMGGRIWVESEENRGSCFFVRIALPEQKQKSIIKKDFSYKNIYIIDSRDTNCLSMEQLLIASGAKCFKASNKEEARKLFMKQEQRPDLILIDSELLFSTEMSESFLIDDLDMVKVVLLVNPKNMSKHSGLAKSKGIDDFLLKPIKRKELFRKANKVINKIDESLVDDVVKDTRETTKEARHILLVEDNPDNRMLIKAYLKKTNHNLDEAENGAIAVDMFKQSSYDIVFMDVQMPVMDGHQATRLIRSWEKEKNKKHTKIVSLTAHAMKEEIDKCLAAGCDTHLSKPIKKATLLQMIEELSS
jgi:two-component system, sensor histidine kinase and response regulator